MIERDTLGAQMMTMSLETEFNFDFRYFEFDSRDLYLRDLGERKQKTYKFMHRFSSIKSLFKLISTENLSHLDWMESRQHFSKKSSV